MGANGSSHLEKDTNGESASSNEHFFGLVNFGNTCYCNSVIQALYYLRPFREKLLQYRQQVKKSGSHKDKDSLVVCLADLFQSISSQKRRMGTLAPKRFVNKLKKENELFDNFMQQDAHEFLNFLLNTISDTLIKDRKREKDAELIRHERGGTLKKGSSAHAHHPTSTAESNGNGPKSPTKQEKTWIHDLFEGTLLNETRCLNCDSKSPKEENFLDLSVDVQQNVSITHCLRVFTQTEQLCGEQKYYCEICNALTEAEKTMQIKKLPPLLALHLKRFRFKYVDSITRHTKLSYRVLFPIELRLFNTVDATGDPLYDLVAAVIHCGATPNRGHYITLVKSGNHWLLFDDDIVEKLEINSLEEFSGISHEATPLAPSSATIQTQQSKNAESAYILFYQARDPEAAGMDTGPSSPQPNTNDNTNGST